MREILLSGKSPHIIHQGWIDKIKHDNPTNDKTKGLVPEDVKFLLDMPAQWHSFWIPDARNSYTDLDNQPQRDSAFKQILEHVNNPKVRHRILLFRQRLEQLKTEHGIPDRVIIEIVRDDFMGKEKKREYEQFLHRMQKEKAEALKDAESSGIKGRDAVLKLRLYREQKGFDVYSGLPIALEHVDHCQIDHIVPRSLGGPDALYNKVLTTAKNNAVKGNRTPYQWLHDGATNHWDDYLKTIPGKALSKKKLQLLTSTEATELVSKYTALAETAHMVQLARKVVCITFGWAENAANTVNNLKVVSGGETAKLRQRLRLDSILHPEMDIEKLKETVLSGKLNSKNRENPRHHALDALTASVIPEVRYDTKSNSDVIPGWFTKDYCAKALAHVTPPLIRFERGNLAQTIFGIRHNALIGKKNGKVEKQTVLVGREELHKKVKMGVTFTLQALQKHS